MAPGCTAFVHRRVLHAAKQSTITALMQALILNSVIITIRNSMKSWRIQETWELVGHKCP